jgi:hypothetical protein
MRAFEKNRQNEPTLAIPPHDPSNFLPDAFRYRVLVRNSATPIAIEFTLYVTSTLRLSFRAITAAIENHLGLQTHIEE